MSPYAGDYIVLPGAIVLMSQWLMHCDARFFPDPSVSIPTLAVEAEAAVPVRALSVQAVIACAGESFA